MHATPAKDVVPQFPATLPFLADAIRKNNPRRNHSRHSREGFPPSVVRVEDCRIMNTAVAMQVEIHVRLTNQGEKPSAGSLKLEILDPKTKLVVATVTLPVQVGAGETRTVCHTLSAPNARVWQFDTQELYELGVSWQSQRFEQPAASYRLDFAFRHLAGEGVGRDEMFRLRNRKERLLAVLPWASWSTSGLEAVGVPPAVSTGKKPAGCDGNQDFDLLTARRPEGSASRLTSAA